MDQDKTSFGMGADDGGRPLRPLGRGLEDISRLFRPAGSSDATNERRPGSSPGGAGPDAVLLGARTSLTRDQLAPLLRQFEGALDEGLTSIDAEIACPPCGEIDLLGLSRAQQLTIIDFETAAGDGLLIRGLGHVDWVTRNVPIIRRLYPGHAINYSLPPALMLVAPQFSPQLRSAARQLTRPAIKWVRYHALASPAGLGLFFERMDAE